MVCILDRHAKTPEITHNHIFYKRCRKTKDAEYFLQKVQNMGQVRRDMITGVVGAKSSELCSSAAYTFFSPSILPNCT